MKTIEFPVGCPIDAAARMLVEACKTDDAAQGTFNDIVLRAEKASTVDAIVAAYHDDCDRRAESYRNSPEGKEAALAADAARQKAEEHRAEGVLPFKVKDAEGWQKAVDNNTDFYGSGVIRYAARWASLMERKIAEGAKLEDIASSASHEADVEGITGFMYGCAVSILSQVWEHGEQLRRWHNLETQLGVEGEYANETGGVLNPAVLSVR